MKKIIIPTWLTAALLIAMTTGCKEMERPLNISRVEMSVFPGSEKAVTKGYSEGEEFYETTSQTLHSEMKAVTPRTMQISAYLYPQNGTEGNYFVGKTFSRLKNGTEVWVNTNTVGGEHDPIYWPVEGKVDFLAYSISAEGTKNIVAEWDVKNASSCVTLSVPGENSQNDILYASAYGIPSSQASKSVGLGFKHAQAWLEFELTGTPDSIKLERIVIENAFNAGKLVLRNGNGEATAVWNFADDLRQDISVDNPMGICELNDKPQFLDILIPQQSKTSLGIYYSEGTSPAVEKFYRIETDKKTWIMGEKYTYKININASEITASATSTE